MHFETIEAVLREFELFIYICMYVYTFSFLFWYWYVFFYLFSSFCCCCSMNYQMMFSFIGYQFSLFWSFDERMVAMAVTERSIVIPVAT